MPLLRLLSTLVLCSWGLATQAATIRDVDLDLTFAGHSYFDVEILDLNGPVPTLIFKADRLNQSDDLWGLPRLFSELVIGESTDFTARFQQEPGGSGDAVLSCRLAGLNCANATTVILEDDSFGLLFGTTQSLSGSLLAGGGIVFDFLPEPFSGALLGNNIFASWSLWRADFTVADRPQPSPIPLPASVLLLPLGLGGLGLIRRRIRPVSLSE
jgi:hypothetical protein